MKMSTSINRADYRALYGPTTGDLIRLADTNLLVEVEADYSSYGDELLSGFGKTIRDGMMASSRPGRATALDLLISNAVVLDPLLGAVKANIGVKDGRVVGVGRAGNPDIQDNIELILGANTGVIPAEGLLATPGFVDSHVHLASPNVISTALSAGITTLVCMGYGGVFDQGVGPAYNFDRLVEAFEWWPVNIAFLARAAYDASTMERAIERGAAGFKVHEDQGAFSTIIDAALSMAELHDVQVALHSDSYNEAGELGETLEAIGGRTVHAYHVEGAGGGHPNILEIVAQPHVLGSSTTPTIPFSVNTAAEQAAMMITAHRLNTALPEDLAAARDRVRVSTIAAEQRLHDLGAIPIIASDAQGMGRIGELSVRTWQMAHRVKELEGDALSPGRDNERIRRFLAKITVNPARAHGMSDLVGSLEPGKLADIVLWRPEFFGIKPELVIKAGFAAWGAIGDGNGTTRVIEPRMYRRMFGSSGTAPSSLGVLFVAGGASRPVRDRRVLRKRSGVHGCRGITKSNMIANQASPAVVVNPDALVTIDGADVELDAATELPLSRRYVLS
jgi:urease subunit alpha